MIDPTKTGADLHVRFTGQGFDCRLLVNQPLFQQALVQFAEGRYTYANLLRIANNLAIFNPRLKPGRKENQATNSVPL